MRVVGGLPGLVDGIEVVDEVAELVGVGVEGGCEFVVGCSYVVEDLGDPFS